MPPGKYLADGLPSGCTVSLTGAQYKILTQVNKDMTGAGGRRDSPGPVKREAGERPARSRRCERGVMLHAAKGKGSGCHWEEEPFPAGKGPGLYVPGGWLRKGRIPGKAEAGGDAQVRRPACHVCHEATRNWLARNARGTRAFGSAERSAKVLPRNILLKTRGWKTAFLF